MIPSALSFGKDLSSLFVHLVRESGECSRVLKCCLSEVVMSGPWE